jgi:transposase-like protein
MTVNLTDPIYNNEDAARRHFEASRWPDGPICPFCGSVNNAHEMQGKSTRPGLYKCREKECRKPFTATLGTLYERSHIPLHKWLLATHLMTASKKGMSAHQLYRMLGFGSYRTAWFMAMRIRESMRDLFPEEADKMGGDGKTAEIDATYVGGLWKNKHAKKRPLRGLGPTHDKAPVFALVERGGKVRSYHVPEVTGANLREIVEAQLAGETIVYTDGDHTSRYSARSFETDFVNHSAGEYVRGTVHTNTIEGVFAILKRGLIGTYHHVSQQHLKRYLAEFDFRYNERSALGVEDTERAAKALKGVIGKRLTYRQPLGGSSEAGPA